jgi:hypothetical protein
LTTQPGLIGEIANAFSILEGVTDRGFVQQTVGFWRRVRFVGTGEDDDDFAAPFAFEQSKLREGTGDDFFVEFRQFATDRRLPLRLFFGQIFEGVAQAIGGLEEHRSGIALADALEGARPFTPLAREESGEVEGPFNEPRKRNRARDGAGAWDHLNRKASSTH